MEVSPVDPQKKEAPSTEAEEKDAKKQEQTSGGRQSFWVASVQPMLFEKLSTDLDIEVVVIGGGIAGVTAAYCLQRSGKRTVLIEDGAIGSGETGRTTAHLVTALDDRYYELEKMFGKKNTRLIAESHRQAIDFIEIVVQNEGIDCDFERVPGYLFRHHTDEPDSLLKEFQAASEAMLDVTELDLVPNMMNENGRCLRFNNQAQFHPMKYLQGLCRAFVKAGGKIFTETHAREITSEGVVTDEGCTIRAQHVVVATNTPVNNKFMLHLRQYPYRTYVIGAKVRKGLLPHALWWDTGDFETNKEVPPYHYVRLQRLDDEYDLLIVGGQDHPTGLADAYEVPEERRHNLLEVWTKKHFPIEEVVYRWSGQVLEPMDSIAFIGRNPMDRDNVYIITGDSGNGMTHGTIGGMLITDLINGKKNAWEKVYNPSRFKLLTAGKTFLKELFTNMADYLRTKQKPEHDIESLKPGDAKIMEVDGKIYGVYCDENSYLHLVSAECTHLKCVVKWNALEKTWDCPCHGSRFTYEGRVLNGPANADLDHYKTKLDELIVHHEDKH